jgi:hypothetical protein
LRVTNNDDSPPPPSLPFNDYLVDSNIAMISFESQPIRMISIIQVSLSRCHYPGRISIIVTMVHKEIQKGAVAKSYMTNGLLIYE